MGDVVSAAADLVGMGPASIQADATTDAARIGAGASAAATAAQERMFNKQMELQAPFREAGLTAQNRLLSLLGLSPTSAKTYDQYRAELLPQYTTNAPANVGRSSGLNGLFGLPDNYSSLPEHLQAFILRNTDFSPEQAASINAQLSQQRTSSTVNEAALDAAIRARMAEDANAPKAADFGKYARDFSMADFEADPGYAFRLSEGQKALDRQAAARGGLISGSALKAATRYGQDMGSQEYTNAFNRYQTNRANQLQPLQSLAGVSQTATNQMGNAASNYGTNLSNLALGAGATAGNAAIAQGNIRASQYGTMGSAANTLWNNRQAISNWWNGGDQYTPGSNSFVGPMPQ